MKKILTLLFVSVSIFCFGQTELKLNIFNSSNCPVSFVLVMSTLTTTTNPLTPNCLVGSSTSVIQVPPGGTATFGFNGVPGLPIVPPGTVRYFLGARILNGPMGCSGFTYYNAGLPCAGMASSQPIALRDNNCNTCNPNLTATWTVIANNTAVLRFF